ncbi:MAG: ribose-5-phosphate isomerase RpiA [Methylobacteriaceae bacterium]|nr:ribose-5-phosphate isomerase RpiA [Methylobacteriaceae bacterium]
MSAPTPDDMKRRAAARAMAFVRPGMRLGLGTGSTARHFVDLLGAAVRDGLDVVGVPTSEATRAQAEALRIPLTDLDATPELDLTIDGADEFDAALRLIKGGGGALLREKIVAAASARMVVIADSSKRVERLGRFPLPVEVAPFGLESTRRAVAAAARAAGCAGAITLRRRADGAVFATDGGHYILDCAFGVIPDPEALAAALDPLPGVMGHGLFLGLASVVICAGGEDVEMFGAAA